MHLHIQEECNFKQVYDCVIEKHPTLFNVAKLIENALFLKLVFREDLDLKPSHSYPSNDNLTSANNRVVCYDYRRANNKPHKQIHIKQSDVRYLL